MSEVFKNLFMEAGAWRLHQHLTPDGEPSNNELDLSRVLRPESDNSRGWQIREIVLNELLGRVFRRNATGVWGTPGTGMAFAEAVVESSRVKLALVRLAVPEYDGQVEPPVDYATEADRKTAAQHRLVGITGSTGRMRSLRRALAVPGLAEKTEAVVVGWRRGEPIFEKPIASPPIEWLVEQVIPQTVNQEDPLYQQYKDEVRIPEGWTW